MSQTDQPDPVNDSDLIIDTGLTPGSEGEALTGAGAGTAAAVDNKASTQTQGGGASSV